MSLFSNGPQLSKILAGLLITSGLGFAAPAIALPTGDIAEATDLEVRDQQPENDAIDDADGVDTDGEDSNAIAPVAFPTAGITLIPPADFEPAALFDGFQQEATQSSIMVLSLPAPTDELLQAFSDEASLSQRGMTLVSQEPVSINGQADQLIPGQLIQLEQAAYGQTFGKWILIFDPDPQNTSQTTILNASFPKALADDLSSPIKASLLSIQIDSSPTTPPEANADFSITPTGSFDLALTLSGTQLYSQNGELNNGDPAAPLFVISPSFSNVLAVDQGQFARDRLQQTEQVEAIAIQSEAPVIIDNLEGYEITATAQDINTATPLLIHQTILFSEDRYYILQGLVGEANNGETHLQDFQTMAQSFRLTP